VIRYLRSFGVIEIDIFGIDKFGIDKFEFDKIGLHGKMNTHLSETIFLL
jgi:hypothetical protein